METEQNGGGEGSEGVKHINKIMNWRHQGKNYCSIFKLYQVVRDLMNFITALSIYIYVCKKFRDGLITARSRSKVVAEITTLME